MRKIFVAYILPVLILLGAFFIGFRVFKKQTKEDPPRPKIVKQVKVTKVQNQDIPVLVQATGTATAKQKIALFSEVQGVLSRGSREFKPGTYFNRGETLLRINSDEFRASLNALKSNFYSQLTALMPDLRLDFPQAYPKWESYLQSLDIQKTLPQLPAFTSDQEKYFITGRNILNLYYQVKNAEVRLSKYYLRAPFSGILSETNVNPGALVSPGQNLGTFINTGVYELELKVNAQFLDVLQKGKKVTLHDLDHTKTWEGIVNRINPVVDTQSQSVSVYIDLKDKTIKEGMYLQAELQGKNITDAVAIKRNQLREGQVFIVQDTLLIARPVNIMHEDGDNLIVRGLENGDMLVKQLPSGAHEGMLVQAITDQSKNAN